MAALERAGAKPIGFDLSSLLLRKAREVTARPLVRADMRALPFGAGTMDLTVNLFTSFGYFAADEEHADAIGQMLSTVRPGGWFVIDFLNAEHVRAALVAAETARYGDSLVNISRTLTPDGQFVRKSISLPDGRRFHERVRLLEAADLERMITAHGAIIRGRYGDYAGGPLQGGNRTILTAQVPA